MASPLLFKTFGFIPRNGINSERDAAYNLSLYYNGITISRPALFKRRAALNITKIQINLMYSERLLS